jgi:hypothetical protein
MNRESEPDPRHEEREPSAAEWAELSRVLRAVGLDPERGGLATGLDSQAEQLAPDAETSAWLARVVEVDRRRARVVGRASRRRRFELREALSEAGFRVERGSRWTRGLVLALAYGQLRLRESRALRIAGVLLFVHLLAMPVTAWVVRERPQDPEAVSHGVMLGRMQVEAELLAEEPYVDITAEDPRERYDGLGAPDPGR